MPIAVVTALAAVPAGAREPGAGQHQLRHPRRRGQSPPAWWSLVYGFTQAAQSGWASATTLTFLVAAAVLLAAFVVIEMRSKNPLLPMRVILDRNRGGSFLSSLWSGSALLGMFLFLTYYFQGNLGYSALKTGFAFLPFSAGIIVAAGVGQQDPAPDRPPAS